MDQCTKHLFDGAVDRCKVCDNEFCEQCLVYAHGANNPPMCVPCAITAAGVRSSAGRAPAKAKERRRLFSRP